MSALMPGQLLRLGPEASPQWVAPGILFRLTGPAKSSVYYDGWVWLDGYQLDEAGDATERRSVFARVAGVRVVNLPAVASITPADAKPRQRRPAA